MVFLVILLGAVVVTLLLTGLALVLVKPLPGKSRWQSIWSGNREAFHHWPGSSG